jgi:multiple sugar transport system permease protein
VDRIVAPLPDAAPPRNRVGAKVTLLRMGGPLVRDHRRSGISTVGAVLVIAIFLAPLLLAFLGSLRPTGTSPPTTIDLYPAGADLSNYGDLLEQGSISRQTLNSLLVAAISVPVGTVVASWAGFAIARLPRRPALFLLGLTLVAAMIPMTALFVGRLVLFRLAGLTDTPVPLMAPALIGVSPLLVLLFAWSYFTISRETYDLAREAGLGPFRTWWRVAMPLRIDVAGVAAAVAFMISWGNLVDPLLYVYDERWFTLPLGLASLAELPPTDQGLMLAAAVFAIAPVLVTAFVAQRFVYARRW